MSHPFVERLIRSIRHELLDQVLFWSSQDLQKKLDGYQLYFNQHRSHTSLNTETPHQKADQLKQDTISIENYTWQPHCKQLFQLPTST
jgi:putative transposase